MLKTAKQQTKMELPRLFYKSIAYLLLKAFILLRFVGPTSSSTDFNRDYTGVTFLPFVLSKNERGSFENKWDRKIFHIASTRVMMRVVANKFSRLLTYGMGVSRTGPYVYNVSYHNDITVEGCTAEAAATVNKEMGYKTLSILQGVWNIHGAYLKYEVSLALEATGKAHQIFPGTVEGIGYMDYLNGNSKNDAKRTTDFIRMVRNSSFPKLHVGALWKCDKLMWDLEEKQIGKPNDFVTFLNESNFIICNQDGELSANFESLTKRLLIIREHFLKINSRIRVMARIKWKTDRSHTLEDLKNFRSYWEAVDSWAAINKFPVYLDEAIENPYRLAEGGYGWWNLSDNGKIDKIEGYIQQVPDPDRISILEQILIICGIVLAVVVLIFGLYVLFKLVRKCFTKSQVYMLSNVILEFEEGLEEKSLPGESHGIPCYEALKAPYDKSLEISNEQFTFDKESIFQVGPSYCVHTGEILLPGERKPIWLRMSLKNCHVNDMKEMLHEIKILTYLRGHPNIIALKGVCTKELYWGKLWTALELCPVGSLDKYLRSEWTFSQLRNLNGDPESHTSRNRGNGVGFNATISTRQMICWSYQIAIGMEYLSKKLIIHGSLAACNILLTSSKTAKISGFNLNRQIRDCTEFIKTGKRPNMWRWLSIESLKKCQFSAGSDIWSYGVTLWEIFSMGDTPYTELEWTRGFANDLKNGLRLKPPSYGIPGIYQALYECWILESNRRPDFTKLKQLLKPFLDERIHNAIAEVDIS